MPNKRGQHPLPFPLGVSTEGNDTTRRGKELHNNWMKLTKPALVTACRGLCSLSRCYAD